MVKNLRIKTQEEFSTLWDTKAHTAFFVIFEKRTSELKYEELYDIFRIAIISKMGHLIEEKLTKSFFAIVNVEIERLTKQKFLELDTFLDFYANYKNLIDKVQKIAVYYDSKYAMAKRSSPSEFIGLSMLKEELIRKKVLQKLVSTSLDEINAYREGKSEQAMNIAKVTEVLVIFD